MPQKTITKKPILPSKQEADEFLQSLTTPQPPSSLEEIDIQNDDYILSQNKKIIKAADNMLIDRLENEDGSLRVTDIISAKAEAFKQNRLVQGKTDESPQLIPSTINIAIINN